MPSHVSRWNGDLSPLNQPPAIDGILAIPNGLRRKVAIVGCGYGHEEAPLADPEWDVWALNAIATLDDAGRLRADRWFDLHQRSAQSASDMDWIAHCPVPIYLPDDLLDASPNGVRYPIEAIEAAFGGPYWACTFAYQIALALFEGYRTIGLYGVEVAFGTPRERSVEWANVSWWIGFAEGRGAQIAVPLFSRLGQHPYRYGLEYDAEKASTERYVAKCTSWDAQRGDVSVGG